MKSSILRPIALSLVVLSSFGVLRAEELEPQKTHAVIVGVLEWKHGLTPYPKRNRKDQELRDLLVARGTPPANIALLLDEEAVLPKIREAVTQTARKAGTDSTLLVYYAGHGMPAGNSDYCFANYELDTGDIGGTGWSLRELGETLVREFKGRRVLLCADCCFSGGLEIVVDRLHEAGIAAANLTSASCANTSTNNWTFTQSLIDGLRGEPLVDANDDGRITLGELDGEVSEAMRHLEGQLHGYKTAGIPGDFVLGDSVAPLARVADAKFPVGSYVLAPDDTRKGERKRTGRVVGVTDGRYVVQFYDYSDKRTATLEAGALSASTRDAAVPPAVKDAGLKADCEVEWQKRWWPAKVLEEKDGTYLIHYLGYEDAWNERVGKERIRFPEAKAKNR